MALLPQSRVEKIGFYEAHLPTWEAHAAGIGLSSGQVTTLVDRTQAARAAFLAHQAAADAAKAATEAFYNAVADMQTAGADAVRAIRNQAETANNPNVYVLALIPAPARHSPAPPPGTPTAFRVELLQTGAIVLSWKCANPSGTVGTMYEVQRRVGTLAGPLVHVGTTGVKQFIDDTLPLGPTTVTYQITAIRSTARGNPAQFTITFGTGGNGSLVASIQSQDVALPGGYAIDIPPPLGNGRTTRRTRVDRIRT